jgi:hypothetical protein
MTNRTNLRLIAMAGLALAPLALLAPSSSQAASSSAGSEFLSNAEAAPPNVIFLVDLSDAMGEDCGEAADTADSGDTGGSSGSGETCLEATLEAIDQLTQHYDWAYFAVVGTSDDHGSDYPLGIASLGSSHAEISAALDEVQLDYDDDSSASYNRISSTDTRNLGEVIESLGSDYLDRNSTGCGGSSWITKSYISGDDFCDAPIQWACQETHIITITVDRPNGDDNVSASPSGMSTDVQCTYDSGIGTTDEDCTYDQAVYDIYNDDLRGSLTGTQNAITHTIAIKVGGTSIAESLYGNASDQIGNDGVYTVANSGDGVLGAITTVMGYIRSGYYSRSAPIVSVDGDRVIYSFYEITGTNPLAEGHVRAYKIDNDPTSTTYGEVVYDGDSQFGGAQWDAGDLLVSRPVTASEQQPDDRDGIGKRDIYTFVEEVYDWNASGSSLYSEANSTKRMGFDYDFANEVSASAKGSEFLELFLDTTDADSDGCADDLAYDLTKDGCDVDQSDLQALIDFSRGLVTSEYRYLDKERGYWKLGDSPHSQAYVTGDRADIFTADPSYQAFLKDRADDAEVVLIAANDGMLHAFRLYDDPTTTSISSSSGSTEDADEAGEELWAWIPAYTLYHDKDEDWSGNLIDMMWYGRTFLFDGSPVVEDVWIDDDADGVKASDGSEWRRVVVVQQAKGGPVTLALDITDAEAPEYLWEQTNEPEVEAMGYTVSRPVIANMYNNEGSTPFDSWTAIWGGGRAVPYTSSASYYTSSEANLYFWHIGDDYWSGRSNSGHYDQQGSNGHPEEGTISATLSDSDSRYEYGYISGAIAAVDADSDGDIDVMYFPVTAAYEPTDMGDVDGDGNSGTNDPSDPGFTWMYKAIIDVTDPDDPTWCEFYDPNDYIGERPEVYYAPTTAWHGDGGLGVYWGTGSPYARESSDYGYLFAVKDDTPLSCSAASPISDCPGAGGTYKLASGEGLTGDPVVFAGTVYFSTYEPATDRCDGGTGRIYGLSFDDCSGTTDLDGDGVVDESIEVDGYPSSVAISENGTLYYGTSNPDTEGSAIGEIAGSTDPFGQIASVGMREMF